MLIIDRGGTNKLTQILINLITQQKSSRAADWFSIFK